MRSPGPRFTVTREIIEKVSRYADAGVAHLAIEPFASNLHDFLGQLERFASEIAPGVAGSF